ncbi:MAG: hypothetical protein MPK62_01600 [Alphaproteobacteria bacterium]|nr:hypothetical protein [Alphaproteobacteria bacterium]MDA8029829.1 hypothetical protein [Alphaproteobacteria bacterium]
MTAAWNARRSCIDCGISFEPKSHNAKRCIDCRVENRRVYVREIHRRNRDRIIAMRKRWRENHPEKYVKPSQEYYERQARRTGRLPRGAYIAKIMEEAAARHARRTAIMDKCNCAGSIKCVLHGGRVPARGEPEEPVWP